jgi:hypothetical protein
MNKRNVQVQMFATTEEKVESLQGLFHASTKSDVIKTSVDIADMVGKVLADKGEVILRDKKGNERKIVIPGVG